MTQETPTAGLTTRPVKVSDLPALVKLAYCSAEEADAAHRVNAKHSESHFLELINTGMGFVVVEDGEVIGTALFTPIDTGWEVLTDAWESAHIFIRRDKRSMKSAGALFDAIRQYAQDNNQVLLLHQISYPSALNGSKKQTNRVEALYKFYEFDGSYGITYACRPK